MCGKNSINCTQYYHGVVYDLYMFYIKLPFVNCCSCLVCIVVI